MTSNKATKIRLKRRPLTNNGPFTQTIVCFSLNSIDLMDLWIRINHH